MYIFLSFITENCNISPDKLLQKALSTASRVRRDCSKGCLQTFTDETIKVLRNKLWTLNFKGRFECALDKLAESKGDSKARMFFTDGGRAVCSNCFRKLYRLNKNFYYKACRQYKFGAVSVGFRSARRISQVTMDCIRWIKSYAYFHGDKMPDKKLILLPYKTRKTTLYLQYVSEQTEDMKVSASKANFFSLWKHKFRHLKIKKVSVLVENFVLLKKI